MRRALPARALTLLEVLLSSTLLVAVLLALSMVIQSSAAVAQADLTHGDALRASRRVLQELSRELADAGGDEFNNDYVPTHPYGATNLDRSSVRFRRRLSLNAVPSGAALTNWSTEIEYRLAPSPGETPGNGVDDDRDGLVDEQSLVRIQDGGQAVLEASVLDFRVSRSATTPDQLRIDLRVGRSYVTDRLDALTHTTSTVLVLANRPTAP